MSCGPQPYWIDDSSPKIHPQIQPISTVDFQCFGCGRMNHIPVRPSFENPLFVMEMEREHRLLNEELNRMGHTLMELANECLDAGVKPQIMRKADEIKRMLDQWKRTLGEL
jgi:hypothetical protein